MTNEFYNHDDGYPAFGAQGASSSMRAQLDKLGVAFDKMPALSGNGNKLIWVKADGTALEVIAALTDVTTYNASITAHGFLPKLSNDATTFINGVGSWIAAPSQLVVKSARTSNTILGLADNAKLIDITANTFTQTFTAAATLGSGWNVWLRNSGTGNITLDPNAAELIDGLASFIMYPGEVRLVQCDGAALTSVVIAPFSVAFTANGTFTKPPGYNQFGILGWSGGSSGARNNNAAAAVAGGGGGGAGQVVLPAPLVGATETVTIGAGGSAVTTVAVGNVGSNSSFGTLFTVYVGSSYKVGGSFLQGLSVSSAPPEGYAGAGNGVTPYGGVWGGGGSGDGTTNSAACLFGGAAGAGIDSGPVLKNAGTSKFGGNGGASSSAGNGTDGTAPGGGGGATNTGTQSGAGARGEIRVWGIA